MRNAFVAAAMLVVVPLVACEKKQVAVNDDLAKDLALASSSDGIALAPSVPGQAIVSAQERIPRHTQVTHSRKGAPHRAPHADRHSTVKSVLPVKIDPKPDNTPAPVVMAPRPEPVNVPSPQPSAGTDPGSGPGTLPEPSDGGVGNHGDGGWGTVVRTGIGIAGVIIRGGVMDGDHCDPRGAGIPVSVNHRYPPVNVRF